VRHCEKFPKQNPIFFGEKYKKHYKYREKDEREREQKGGGSEG
jgi:hypothetical protein